jgi:maltose O-acetyltransferase
MPEHKPTSTQDDNRSQREKMESGDLYLADDPELAAASRRAYLLTREYEKQYAINLGDAHKILQELLGAIAADVHIKPPFFVDYGRYITIGAGTFANYGLMALDVAAITIGKDVLLGPNVQLLTPTHPVDIESRRAKYEAAKPIVIHDNAWLGGGVIVLAGVTIGENSVIGAGSVVTKDIPANAVAVGNPARVIRMIE